MQHSQLKLQLNQTQRVEIQLVWQGLPEKRLRQLAERYARLIARGAQAAAYHGVGLNAEEKGKKDEYRAK